MFRFVAAIFSFLVLLASCSLISDDAGREAPKAVLPLFEIEATVVSLSLDPNEACKEKCPGYEYPLDTGIIQIEKIISIHNPDNVGMIGYQEGDEIDINFLYSARPARVEYIPSISSDTPPRNLPSELPVSGVPVFAEPIPINDGVLVYTVKTSSVEQPVELILPGLQEGSKIRASLIFRTESEGSISDYRLIE